MATILTKEVLDVAVHEIDPNASPLESHTTPNTEYSPPLSPYHGLLQNKRLAAKVKLSKLSQKEKVRFHERRFYNVY